MRFLPCLTLLLAALVASDVVACSCAPPPPPKAALEASAAVFSGKVVDVEDIGDFQRAVTIEVASTWKGVKGRKVTVQTAKHGATCGFGFEKGKSYLVYAYETKQGEAKVLSTNLCTRTRALGDAKDDLTELGEGAKPE